MAVCNLPESGSSGGLVESGWSSDAELSRVVVFCSSVFVRVSDSGRGSAVSFGGAVFAGVSSAGVASWGEVGLVDVGVSVGVSLTGEASSATWSASGGFPS